ncbi:MAG TPA: hypothetical protein VGJ68_08280 [Bradyrhizobium sp.]
MAESLSEELAASAATVGVTGTGSAADAAGSGRRFRNKPNAMGDLSERRKYDRHSRIGA